MRYLIADPNSLSVRTTVAALKPSGAVVDIATSGEDALATLKRYDYDLLLTEAELSGMKGLEVLRRLRAARLNIPVLVLSQAAPPAVKAQYLASGADDYVTKPFDGPELLERVRAVVRRNRGFSHSTIELGPVTIDLGLKHVFVDDKPLHLTNKEYSIIELLAFRRGFVLTKEVFLNHLYGGIDEPEPKIIDVFICKLRKKLAAAGIDDLINTVWGQGYTLQDLKPASARRRAVLEHAEASP